MLMVVFMGSCEKDQESQAFKASSIDKLASLEPLTANLKGIDLGVAGNFAILSKTGITSVYKSTITGDIGTSPITGAALVVSCGSNR